MSPAHKPLVFLSGATIKTPPLTAAARGEVGYLLRQLQAGESLAMPRSRPMPSIGARCHELRVQDETVTWRLVYRIDPKAIVVVEVFTKKTQATPRAVIDTCQQAPTSVRPRNLIMDAKQRKNLAKMGGRVATVQEFLGLSDAEVRLIDLRIQLTRELREQRTARKVTQAQLAKMLRTSQPRVAAMEAGDPQTSLEALLRALFVLGATPTLKVA